MEERQLLLFCENATVDADCKNADGNECKSHLHRWISSGKVRTCSLFTNIPVKLIACGEGHVIFVSDSFQVFSVGTNDYGQLGLGDRVDRKTPREISFLSEKFLDRVSSGPRHSCAISKTGEVFCWGDSRLGQCGHGEKGIFTTPCRVRFIDRSSEAKTGPSNQRGVKALEIACGEKHTLAIDSHGALWSWGSGLATGLGQGDEEILAPRKIKKMGKKRVVQIACGKDHSIALVQEDANVDQGILKNEIVCSYLSDDGNDQLPRTDSNVAQKVPFLENVFYVEEGDGPINWSMDLQKLSRSNTPSVFNDDDDTEVSRTDSDVQSGESEFTSQEDRTPKKSGVSERGSQTTLGNSLGSITTSEIEATDNKSRAGVSEENRKPIEFNNELNSLLEKSGIASDSKNNDTHISMSSLQSLIKRQSVAIPITSKSVDNLVDANEIDGNVRVFGADNRGTPVEISDVHLVEASANELYYSALDVVDKQENENKDNTSSSSSTLDASCQSLQNQRTDRCDPLSLSIDKSMENVILSEHCSFAVDESQDQNIPSVSSSHENILHSRDRSVSTWSIAVTGNTYDIEKIGSVELYGISQVWAWGENSHGQLGIGDSTLVIQRSADPVLIARLRDEDIVLVAAGSLHTLALTRRCQVFGWGDNSSGQLGLHDMKYQQPQKISALSSLRVWDVAAGDSFSIFLADSSSNSCHMYQLGESIKNLEGETPRTSLAPGAALHKRKSFSKLRRSFQKMKKDSMGDSSTSEWYTDTELKKIEHVEKNCLIRTIQGCENQYVCITSSDADKLFKVMHRLASSERYYFYQLGLIQEHLMEPLQKAEHWTAVTKLPGGEALLSLTDCFNDILLLIGVGLSQLTYVIKAGLRVKDLFSFFLSDSFRAGYERYSKCYCDTLAVGHFHSLSKTVSGIISKMKDPIKEVFRNPIAEQSDLATLLKVPLTRTIHYARSVEKLARTMKESGYAKTEEIRQLSEVIQRWQDLSDHTTKRLRDAERTREFWDDSSSKLNEALKDPHRRLIRTSKTAPLSLARASRLASHTFNLFNDVFVHAQSNRHFQVFPLVTTWVEPLADTDQQKNSLRITAPEASSVLISDSPNGRTEWVKELNEAIAECLSVTSLHRITTESVNSISGLLRAADAREASYTYINHMKYKGAKYSGMWMYGQPHGRGRLEWPEGIVYEGEFEHGSFQGYGTMHFSPNSAEVRQRFEGDWQEGKMAGFGQMTYKNGSEYTGHWKNDERVGHGTLKTYSADGGLLQTVYVGDWQNDQKNGYGVQDFLVRGEKYIGMWQNDQRHGFGIVVTVDGVYYEGRFLQNKLAGKGILLSDDDTCYEGEFTADMQLSGKGILTLPNGDYIDGQFYGNWGENIKVNGIFSKFANPDPSLSQIGEIGSSQLTVTDFVVPAGIKWKSLFEECGNDLEGQTSLKEPELSVWKNIENSIIRTRSSDIRRRCTRKRGKEEDPAINVAEKKEVNCHDINEIQSYLAKAIDTYGHPLHTLVEGLVEVYRATYVGVGAHRRLLLHAVEEAKSYVLRLFDVIRHILPALPDEDFVMLSQEKANHTVEHHINSSSVLHPLILPRLYPPLFTLYALHTEKADAVYTERLHQLNKRGDVALMSFLGVNRKFLLCQFDEETKEPIVGDKPPYQSAITELDLLSTKYSPMEKLDVIRRSFEKIHEEVNAFWQGEKKIVAMDDLFPVFQYVVTRARIPHLGSEVQFIEDLVEQSYLGGEMGHMLTTLKASYFQIQNERDRE